MKGSGSTFAPSWKTGLPKTNRNLMAITRRDAALQDLIGLAYYIALDNVETAYRFLDAAEETFRDLEGMPFMGSSRDFQNSALEGIRMWRVKDFPKDLVFY